MSRLLFYLLLFFLLYSLVRFLLKTLTGPKKKEGQGPEELVQDPYCLTYIPKSTALKKKRGGAMLYFCSEKCAKHYSGTNKKVD